MSRLRSALDSVSKVVSGTQGEIRSRIGRLKPGSDREGETKEAALETPSDKQQERLSISTPRQDLPEPSTTNGTHNELRSTAACHGTNNKRVTSQTAAPQDKSTALPTSPVTAQQTTPLFHPGTLSAHLGETYSYLSHHVNSYFGGLIKSETKDISSSTQADPTNRQESSPLVPVKEVEPSVASSAVNKGLGNYFTYSSPSVQAFVGNYIAPLVPRFKSDGKVQADKPSPVENDTGKPKESSASKEQRDADERARRLLLQREKVHNTYYNNTFILLFMHLTDAKCIQALHYFTMCVFPGYQTQHLRH